MQDLWEEFEVLDCGNGANEAKKNNVFDVDLKLIEEWLEEPIYDNEAYWRNQHYSNKNIGHEFIQLKLILKMNWTIL